jgi:FtsP/CotA-like multicopper oxidase with cupredoxin domain
MTRLNVYAGPAGFYLVRGGPDGDDAVLDSRFGTPAVLPGPAPKENDKFPPNKTYYELPMAIQDRSFNTDGATEVWGFYNATADAHPIHIHEIVFEVVNRQATSINEDARTVQGDTGSGPMPPEPWETGFKDTVIAYPGQVTRVRAQFNTPGQFVWHCHLVEHEDNEAGG